MGFGKRYALQIFGVYGDHLAEPFKGVLLRFLNHLVLSGTAGYRALPYPKSGQKPTKKEEP